MIIEKVLFNAHDLIEVHEHEHHEHGHHEHGERKKSDNLKLLEKVDIDN